MPTSRITFEYKQDVLLYRNAGRRIGEQKSEEVPKSPFTALGRLVGIGLLNMRAAPRGASLVAVC